MQGSRARTIALALSTLSMLAPHIGNAEGEGTLEGTPLLTSLDVDGSGKQFVTVIDIGSGVGVFEGDVLVPLAQGISARSSSVKAQSFSVALGGSLWPEGIMPYALDSSLTSAATQKILDAIDHWNTRTPVQIVPRNGETDYVNFVNESGCASYIGRIGGAQPVYSSPNCSTGNFIHEIGHALGLYHEHTRPDRDSYVTINWENIDADRSQNFDIVNSNIQVNTPYDYGSIMHYGERFFSINGEQTITPSQANVSIGQRIALSSDDISGVDSLYSSGFEADFKLSPERPMPGSEISATFDLSNNSGSGSSVQSISVSSTLPTGVEFQEFTGPGWSCSNTGQVLDCSGPSLQNAGTSALDITLKAPVNVSDLDFDFTVSGTALGSDISLNSLATLNMTAVNDPPLIESSLVVLVPHGNIKSAITKIEAEDPNGHTLNNFSIRSQDQSSLLEVDPDSGDIYVSDAAAINALENQSINLTVTVSDGFENSRDTNVTIDVLTAAALSNKNKQPSGSSGGAFTGFWLLPLFALRRLYTVRAKRTV